MLPLALLAFAQVQFHVVVSEFATAAYHAACLTGRLNCSGSVYAQAWNGPLKATPADGAQFDSFQDVFQKLEKAAPAPGSMPLLPNYAGHFPSLQARNRLLACAFESRDGKDFERRASGLVGAEDLAKLRRAIEHTQKRLHPWWESTGKSEADDKARLIRKELKSPKLAALLRALPRLMGANVPSRDFYLDVLPAPLPGVQNNGASLVRNHIPLELGPKMTARDATWVALHEITHATFESAPEAKHLRLQQEFLSSSYGPAMYAYLNEALATGMQLVLYKRLGLADTDPYNNPYIPRLARAAMPLLDAAISAGTSVFDGFAAPYQKAALVQLGEDGASAAFLFSGVAIVSSDEATKQAFVAAFRPIGWVGGEEDLRRFPEMQSARLLLYPEIPSTATIENLPELRKRKSFAYNLGSGAKVQLIVAGATAEDIRDAVGRLARAKSLPAGVVPLPDH